MAYTDPDKLIWWTNGIGDGNANTVGNWSDTEGGVSNGEIPDGFKTLCFSNTSSSANCTFSADAGLSGLCTVANYIYKGVNAGHGGTDNYTGTIDFGTYNMAQTGQVAPYNTIRESLIGGNSSSDKVTIKIGASSVDGVYLKTQFIVTNPYVFLDFNLNAKLHCYNFYLYDTPESLMWSGQGIIEVIGGYAPLVPVVMDDLIYKNTNSNNYVKSFIFGVNYVNDWNTNYTHYDVMLFANIETTLGDLSIPAGTRWYKIKSSVAGQRADLNVSAVTTAHNIGFQDINASGITIDGLDNCIDYGNNNNIIFHLIDNSQAIVIA